MKAARDRALLLIGFAGALRSSELIAIQCNDIARFDAGMEINLPRSEDGPRGRRAHRVDSACEGHEALPCRGARPVVGAFRHQLRSSVPLGQLSRVFGRAQGARVAVRGVGCQTLGQARAWCCGDKVSFWPQPPCRFCTEAALVGMAPWQIREQTGHKSDVTLAKHIRPITKLKIPSLL